MMKERNYTRKCSKASNLALLIIFLIFASYPILGCAAQESGISAINYIDIAVKQDGFVHVSEGLEVNNTIASILVPGDARDISLQDSAGNTLGYDLSSDGDWKLLTFYLVSPDNREISLKYTTLDLTGKKGALWTFSFSTSSVPGRTIVKVDFPEGSLVEDLRPTEILRSPRNLSTSMLLYPQERDFSFEFDYQVSQGGGEDQQNPPYTLVISVMAVIILSGFMYFFYQRAKKKTKPRASGSKIVDLPPEVEEISSSISMGEVSLGIEVNGRKLKTSVLNMLEENERRVVELMENSEEEITQAYVYKTTGIPKATLSDVIKRLESRNIIEKRKEGRTNWLKLQKWIFSK